MCLLRDVRTQYSVLRTTCATPQRGVSAEHYARAGIKRSSSRGPRHVRESLARVRTPGDLNSRPFLHVLSSLWVFHRLALYAPHPERSNSSLSSLHWRE